MTGGFVYILTNTHNTTLYVGVTSALFSRAVEHRDKIFPKSFSAKYNLIKLVYYEVFDSIVDAIAREKQLKAGSRKRKVKLISNYNPQWNDLFEKLANAEWHEVPLRVNDQTPTHPTSTPSPRHSEN